MRACVRVGVRVRSLDWAGRDWTWDVWVSTVTKQVYIYGRVGGKQKQQINTTRISSRMNKQTRPMAKRGEARPAKHQEEKNMKQAA